MKGKQKSFEIAIFRARFCFSAPFVLGGILVALKEAKQQHGMFLFNSMVSGFY
jgi:hypothetical protein